MDQSEQRTPEPSSGPAKQPMPTENDDYDLSQPKVEEIRGSTPGSVRVRITRPPHPGFRRVKKGVLEAIQAVETPSTGLGRVGYALKRMLVGDPIPSMQAEHERLTKFKALAVLSSDAISSVAYATEAILINLVAAGSLALGMTLPVSLVIIGLLVIVAISYRQTIPAYPGGGGSYIVAKENLGTLPGLIAAAALLIDYVLNVSVSVAAGIQNLAFLFPVFQIATLGILALSAETSYSDFPRLASLLARDRFLPHQFSFKGDRLAFSVGIICLAVLASLLLIVFKGDTNQLINLFAVGVFISFTLSQAGMVLHWWRLRTEQKGWLRSMAINGLGACTTLLVSLIISITKFTSGAWMVVLLIPALVLMFLGIARHYQRVEQEHIADIPVRPQDIHHRLIVPMERLDRATVQSLAYARSISSHVTAVHVAIDEQEANTTRVAWEEWQKQIREEEGTPLLIIESPYRSLLRPLLAYIDTLHERHPEDTLTVILPEFVVAHWWEYFLHNQTALLLKAALLFRPGVVVINVPQHLGDRLRPLKHRHRI